MSLFRLVNVGASVGTDTSGAWELALDLPHTHPYVAFCTVGNTSSDPAILVWLGAGAPELSPADEWSGIRSLLLSGYSTVLDDTLDLYVHMLCTTEPVEFEEGPGPGGGSGPLGGGGSLGS